jgi:hypothetical protein
MKLDYARARRVFWQVSLDPFASEIEYREALPANDLLHHDSEPNTCILYLFLSQSSYTFGKTLQGFLNKMLASKGKQWSFDVSNPNPIPTCGIQL